MDFASELASFRTAHPDIEEAEVFVVDLNARVRGKTVPIAALDKLAAGQMKMPTATPGLDFFSGDVVGGGLAIETGDPDGPLDAVPGSLGRMLWADRPTAQVQVTIRHPDGRIAGFDARNQLASIVTAAHARGLTPVTALELEFFLIDPDRPLPPCPPGGGERLSGGQVYDLEIARAFDPVLDAITRSARALGAQTDGIVTEYATGQFEVNLRHLPDPLAAADQMIALKRAIRGAARAQGLDASFMPRPWDGMIGSGLHLHLSLLDTQGQNVFAAGDGPNPALRHAVGGCLAAMADCMLIFAPHLNSYRRLQPGALAPAAATWSIDNRGAAVRIPEATGPAARLEHPVAGADANPYLVTAASRAGALQGLDGGAAPPPPRGGGIKAGMGTALPLEWSSAETAFAQSAFIARWCDPMFHHLFAAMKRQERAHLLDRITDVEHQVYLRKL